MLRVELTHDLLTQVARESRDRRQKRDAEQRAREQDDARRRRSRRFAAIGGFATVGAVALAVVFAILLEQSTKEKQRLIETQSEVLLAQANGQLDMNVAGEPQDILARSMDLNPANRAAIGRAVSYLSQRTFARKVAQLQIRMDAGDVYSSVEWRDGGSISFVTGKGAAVIPLPPDPAPREMRIRPGGDASIAQRGALRIVRGAPAQAAWAENELPINTTADGGVIAWIEGKNRLRVAWRGDARELVVALPEGARAPLVFSPDGERLMLRTSKGRVNVFALSRKGGEPVPWKLTQVCRK